ncbi:MAG TPA: hypothetical protein VIX59_19870 [Candidatus Binataceae bacterium]
MFDRERAFAFGGLAKRRRTRGLSPGAAHVDGAENRGAEVTGAGRGQHGAAVARVEHHVMDDVAEEMRPVEAPGAARRIAMIDERALASADQQDYSCAAKTANRIGPRTPRRAPPDS